MWAVKQDKTGTVFSNKICELLRKIAGLNLSGSVTLVLDNARYQHCDLVKCLAEQLHIQLMFLPSYSPNLNLIERLWKFLKRDVLYGRHYPDFIQFCNAIDGSLDKFTTDHQDSLKALMTHKFQVFDKTSFLSA